MKIYDLTHKTENNMTAYSLEEKPDIKNLFSIEKDGFNVTFLGLSSHLETHLNVSLHMIENGKNICDFPLETVLGKDFYFSCLPLKGEFDGCPVRAAAIIF